MICPSCGVEFDPDLLLRTRKGKTMSSKIVSNKDNELTADISNLDDIDNESDSEVVTDDDPLLEIQADGQDGVTDDGIVIDEDIAYIDDDSSEDDDVSDEKNISVEVSEEDKE